MRKITLAGIAAVAAFGVAWSASTFAKSRVGKAEVVAASIAPHEIMVQLGRSLPSEYWSHPY